MFKLDLPVNVESAAKIAFKRMNEEQRKSRIFGNERNRTIGFDYATLSAQVLEKTQRDEQERQFQIAGDLELVRQDKTICFLEQQKREEIKQMQKAELEYRMTKQTKAQSREFDLNDPQMLRKSLPARVGDVDLRLGPSSLQIFTGEDLNFKNRQALQAEQKRQWNQQQMDAKAKEKEDAAELVRVQALQAQHQEAGLNYIVHKENDARQEMNKETLAINLALATEKANRKREQFALESQQKVNDMMATVNSSILKEDRGEAVLPNGRILVDKFRGFSNEQLEGIRKDQARQIAELHVAQEAEKERLAAHARQAALFDRSAVLLERKTQKLRKQHDLQAAQENLSLAGIAKTARTTELSMLKSIKPEDSYYSQFNTTTR